MQYKVINIATRDAKELGKLSFFEECRDFPYEIKRVYYIYDCPAGTERGGHAHMHLNQLLFCPYGSIEIILDDSMERISLLLNDPQKGLIIGPGLWREMIWKKDDSVLCVAASEYYDEKDYIRDYNQFREYVRKNRKDDRVC